MNDDPLPNSSTSYFTPTIPDATAKANEAEAKKALDAAPFIDKVIEWFDEVIASTDSIAAAQEEATRRNKSIESMCDAYDITRSLLEAKRNELQSLASTIK